MKKTLNIFRTPGWKSSIVLALLKTTATNLDARCACNKTLSLSTEGRPAVVRHVDGGKHKETAKTKEGFFTKSRPIDVFVVADSDSQSIATVQELQQKQTMGFLSVHVMEWAITSGECLKATKLH